jgi:hypothetical protein
VARARAGCGNRYIFKETLRRLGLGRGGGRWQDLLAAEAAAGRAVPVRLQIYLLTHGLAPPGRLSSLRVSHSRSRFVWRICMGAWSI